MSWEQTIGLAGGIVGGLIGLAGGIVGIYFSIKNTNGPREHAFMIKAGVVCLAAILLFFWLMYVLPNPYRFFLWIPYSILLPLSIIFGNRAQQRIRKEESQVRREPVAMETKAEDPFPDLIDRLRQDGLIDEANTLNVLLREMAWTTGTEFLGEFGLAMKKMRKTVRRCASAETKAAFKASAKVVRRAWPQMFWW